MFSSIRLPSQDSWDEKKVTELTRELLENGDRVSNVVNSSTYVVKFILCSFYPLNFLVAVWSEEEIATREQTMKTSILEVKKQGKLSS